MHEGEKAMMSRAKVLQGNQERYLRSGSRWFGNKGSLAKGLQERKRAVWQQHSIYLG